MSLPETFPHAGPGQLLLIGGGGHSLVVSEAARLGGWTLSGYFDDAACGLVQDKFGIPKLGTIASVLSGMALPAGRWHLSMGNLTLRGALAERLGSGAGTVVHPSAFVSPSAELGEGVFVGPRAVVHTLASVGAHAIINTGAVVEHECQIGAGSHLAPGATLGGDVRVGAGTLLAIGCRVVPGVRIGSRCVVAAGAVVIRDVPDGARVRGVPAKPF